MDKLEYKYIVGRINTLMQRAKDYHHDLTLRGNHQEAVATAHEIIAYYNVLQILATGARR